MNRPISFTRERGSAGSLARAGTIHTPHGDIKTPAFVPVATKASVKGMMPRMLAELGVQVVIGNAYHLYLEPGEKAVAAAKGLGKYMAWPGPTMTDSGGFQVFSLGAGFGKKISKFLPEEVARESATALWSEELASSHSKLAIIDEEGVSFTSHLDGTLHRFTPERSMEIQHALGADIIFAFDECTAPGAPYEYQKEALNRTHAWAKRSLAAHRGNLEANAKQGIYGIVQGGRFADLRGESARTLAGMDFDGYGIGGSFDKADLLATLEETNHLLPEQKPRHLLGIGEPEDLFLGVAAGIDTFDCVLPTRNGRAGTLYTPDGKLNIGNARFRDERRPIQEGCDCPACASFGTDYIAHLFRAGEMLGSVLATAHNLRFLLRLTDGIRQSLLDDSFERFRDNFLARYNTKA